MLDSLTARTHDSLTFLPWSLPCVSFSSHTRLTICIPCWDPGHNFSQVPNRSSGNAPENRSVSCFPRGCAHRLRAAGAPTCTAFTDAHVHACADEICCTNIAHIRSLVMLTHTPHPCHGFNRPVMEALIRNKSPRIGHRAPKRLLPSLHPWSPRLVMTCTQEKEPVLGSRGTTPRLVRTREDTMNNSRHASV